MFAMGKRVWFSKGSTANIKITTPDDLKLFRGWVLASKECGWRSFLIWFTAKRPGHKALGASPFRGAQHESVVKLNLLDLVIF